jgi:type IV secretion system protein VirB1
MIRKTQRDDGSCKTGTWLAKLAFLGFACLILGLPARAQQQRAGARLSEAEFVALANRCAPGAPPDTLLAIARTESDLNPNAVSINRPKAAARRAGYAVGELVLSKQPKNRGQARSWLRWFDVHHYTVSLGLMQVNSEIAPQFHLKPEELLDPCTNLRVGTGILISVYTQAAHEIGQGFPALDIALSRYNSGNSITGFSNGYVAAIYAHAPGESARF